MKTKVGHLIFGFKLGQKIKIGEQKEFRIFLLMTPSQFQSDDFSLSETGIHLLRNNFNFKTLSYAEITRARVTWSVRLRPLFRNGKLPEFERYLISRLGPVLEVEDFNKVPRTTTDS